MKFLDDLRGRLFPLNVVVWVAIGAQVLGLLLGAMGGAGVVGMIKGRELAELRADQAEAQRAVVFFAVFHFSLPEDLPLTQSKVGDTSRSLGKLTPPYDFEIREVGPNEKLDFD